jgi:hypothetical protein
MQFNHPEVLYALFFLIIPIIVHLFQLRKFRKESFTNVKFLKRLSQQTRKSSRLKKWLVLATRLLLLSFIIFAFSRPYLFKDQEDIESVETVIYLDNSYSMQATGQRGRLLERSIQELLENLPEDKNFTLITNNDQFAEVSRGELQDISYSPATIDFNSVLLKAKSRFSTDTSSGKKLLLISDFQENFKFPASFNGSAIDVYALPVRPGQQDNISIDTLYQSGETLGTQMLKVQLSYNGKQPGSVPVSIYNGKELLGKSSVDFSQGNGQQMLEFPIEDKVIKDGRVQVEDNGFQFDNILYFTINQIQPIKIISIDAANSDFLNRIFSSAEFEFMAMQENQIDYNTLTGSQVIILNELQDLSSSLQGTLSQQVRKDAVFIVIPSSEKVGTGLQNLMQELGISGFGNKQDQEKLVTNISFQHPLFSDVFEEQVRNFEYPKVQASYTLPRGAYSTVLSFEDKSPFLIGTRGNFIFAAPLNVENSNFKQSPLIVPSFYNMGISALKPRQLYYLLEETSKIEVPVILKEDQILKITSPSFDFIPQQQKFTSKVEIITGENLETPGNYNVMNNNYLIMGLSFNVNRNENNLNYPDLPDVEDFERVDSLSKFFTAAGYNEAEDSLWKWFITFAIIFLIIETLLLKYLK